ncbi:MAG: hypothetical protein K2G70_02015 [Turicibacter sp.]|nr:hypothetical protein [Turicibacter sp.]
MEYLYDITFWLADEQRRQSINLTHYKELFLEAKEHYNAVGSRARNEKTIISLDIEEQELKFRLSSQVPLSTPTLALRSYSQYLVESEFGEIGVVKGALFRGKFEIVEVERDDITGPEMVKILTELIMSGKKSDEELIQSIKQKLMKWKRKQ